MLSQTLFSAVNIQNVFKFNQVSFFFCITNEVAGTQYLYSFTQYKLTLHKVLPTLDIALNNTISLEDKKAK